MYNNNNSNVNNFNSRSRSPPEGMAMSPPVLPPSPTRTAPTIHKFTIPKTVGLGTILAGGINREDGPNIYIERILAGKDAAKVSYLIAFICRR